MNLAQIGSAQFQEICNVEKEEHVACMELDFCIFFNSIQFIGYKMRSSQKNNLTVMKQGIDRVSK